MARVCDDINLRKFFDKIEIVTPIEFVDQVRLSLLKPLELS